MEENKNTVTEPAAPKPGTKDALKAENDALKAELEAMKAKESENDALKAELENAQSKGPDAPSEEKPKEKMVKIRIPRTKSNQEDVFVSVNMRTWLIKRGVEVEVPACVAEVLRHQEEMLEIIMLFDDAHKNGD